MFFILKPDEPLLKSLGIQPGAAATNLVNDKPGLKETADNVVKIVALLPDEYRKVFFLKVVQGMSVYQISVIRKCTMIRVYLDIEKVRRYMRKNVEDYRVMVST